MSELFKMDKNQKHLPCESPKPTKKSTGQHSPSMWITWKNIMTKLAGVAVAFRLMTLTGFQNG